MHRFRAILVGILVLLSAGCDETRQTKQIEAFDVVEASIADIQRAISSGDTSCRAIVETYLDRIEAYDKATGLNAITVINPAALSRAAEIDAVLGMGETLGPLWCAPMLIKDNFNTHDLVTTGGSIILKDNYPPKDAYMVRVLREADAIVIAKTNMAEWAFSPRETISSSFGTTANAYALDRVPAGSSGGTASGVAASFGVAGLGSDTGNSIRGPSSHLALFGIRSTIGLTSRAGVIPLSFHRDIAGPMTRTVEDGARIFNVVAGFDPDDPYTLEGKGKRQKDYTAFLDKGGLRDARIGVLRTLVDADDADAEVIALFEQAITDMQDAGATIVDAVTIANFDTHVVDEGYCNSFRYDMFVYFKSLGDKAPIHDVMDAYTTKRYVPHSKDAFEYYGQAPLDVAPENWEEPCLPYLDNPIRMRFLDAVTAAMDAAEVDVLVYPTWTNPPAHLDYALLEYLGDNSQLVAPATGMPAATVPMGYSHGGLPAGLQILARRYEEGTIFRIAYAYEQITQHRRPPVRYPRLTN